VLEGCKAKKTVSGLLPLPVHRAVTKGGSGAQFAGHWITMEGAKWLRKAPKSPNNVTSTFSMQYVLHPEDHRFEYGAPGHTYIFSGSNMGRQTCFLLRAGADPGGAIGTIAPLKPTKVNFFTMILHNLENSICDLRPFCFHCFVTAVLWSILHLSYSSEPVMRINCQILNLLAGSATGPGRQLTSLRPCRCI